MPCITVLLSACASSRIVPILAQVAERHWNAHAFINIAVWLSVGEGSSSSNKSASITDARVVFGYPAAQDGVHSLTLPVLLLSVCPAVLPKPCLKP